MSGVLIRTRAWLGNAGLIRADPDAGMPIPDWHSQIMEKLRCRTKRFYGIYFWRTGWIPFRHQIASRVCLSPPLAVWTGRVQPCPPPAVRDVQVLSISIPSRMYPSKPPELWTCRVHPSTAPAVACRVYPLHRQQCGRALVHLFSPSQFFVKFECPPTPRPASGRFVTVMKNIPDAGIGPSGTGLRRQMPKCRYRWHRPWCRCPAMDASEFFVFSIFCDHIFLNKNYTTVSIKY